MTSFPARPVKCWMASRVLISCPSSLSNSAVNRLSSNSLSSSTPSKSKIIAAKSGIVFEQGRADAHGGRAQHHRLLVIRRHAHAERHDVMAPRQLVEKREERRRLRTQRGDAHESGERQRRRTHRVDKLAHLPDGTAPLLLL